jgi:hypothetical protein
MSKTASKNSSRRRRTTASQAPAEDRTRSKKRGAQQRRRKKRRNENRKLLREVNRVAAMEAVVERDVDPADALQDVLDAAVARLHVAMAHANELDEDEVFRDTMMGKIPNEWLRLEKDLRSEVAVLAGRMIGLNIAGRQANAAEALATAIAPVLSGVFDGLGLTAAQKRKAPELVREHLQLIEGRGYEKEAA